MHLLQMVGKLCTCRALSISSTHAPKFVSLLGFTGKTYLHVVQVVDLCVLIYLQIGKLQPHLVDHLCVHKFLSHIVFGHPRIRTHNKHLVILFGVNFIILFGFNFIIFGFIFITLGFIFIVFFLKPLG
jgi:hypothetical protein